MHFCMERVQNITVKVVIDITILNIDDTFSLCFFGGNNVHSLRLQLMWYLIISVNNVEGHRDMQIIDILRYFLTDI